jgi:hypothetical protein
VQYRPISNPHAFGGIRGVEQGLHFFLRQIRHQTMVSFLEWNCQHAANLLDGGWFSVLQKPEKGADSG